MKKLLTATILAAGMSFVGYNAVAQTSLEPVTPEVAAPSVAQPADAVAAVEIQLPLNLDYTVEITKDGETTKMSCTGKVEEKSTTDSVTEEKETAIPPSRLDSTSITVDEKITIEGDTAKAEVKMTKDGTTVEMEGEVKPKDSSVTGGQFPFDPGMFAGKDITMTFDCSDDSVDSGNTTTPDVEEPALEDSTETPSVEEPTVEETDDSTKGPGDSGY